MPVDNQLNIDSIDPDMHHYNDSLNNFKEYSIDSINVDNTF